MTQMFMTLTQIFAQAKRNVKRKGFNVYSQQVVKGPGQCKKDR